MKTRTYSYLHLQSTNIPDIILKVVIDRLPPLTYLKKSMTLKNAMEIHNAMRTRLLYVYKHIERNLISKKSTSYCQELASLLAIGDRSNLSQ